MRHLLLLGLALALAAPAAAQSLSNAFPNLSFSAPVDLQAPDDGSNRLFVVEQAGRIRVFENDAGVTSSSLFLDINVPVASGGEQGLLGLAFDPDYAQNGYFYVNYTASPPRRTVVARYSVSASDPNVADPASEVVLFTVNQPYSNHNAGQLQFGPPEGPGGERYLYVGMGDGGSANDPQENGQNPGTLLGSMLRLDVDGGGLPLDCAAGTGAATIPADNPFIGQAGFCNEAWAYGLRNPWRYSFDSAGQLWIADVGQGTWEEVNIVDASDAGANFGWDQYEGNSCFEGPCSSAGKTFPEHVYPHTFNTSGGFSVIGGYVYEGPSCAALQGLYVYGDYITRNLWTLDYDGTTATNSLLIGFSGRSMSSFGRDEQGDVYLVDLSASRIYGFDCAADVTVEAAPVGGSVTVGAGGGSFAFDATFTNTTGASQTVQAWVSADLSNGSEIEPALGPQTFTLPAGATLTRRVQVRVPAAAPAGVSTLVVKVGSFPDGSASSARFTLTKAPAAPRATESAEAAWAVTWDQPSAPEHMADGPAPSAAAAAPEVLTVAPNPVTEQAVVRFALPEAGPARVEVLDALGRRVALLADGERAAESHAVTWDATALPAGVYLVRLTTERGTTTARITTR